ncbi:hypothetical protein HOY82DRAFT_294360 [Tuber indicum]|nr:hypothetical protein HOY82DRAFT_294360 [Tuber indicum]
MPHTHRSCILHFRALCAITYPAVLSPPQSSTATTTTATDDDDDDDEHKHVVIIPVMVINKQPSHMISVQVPSPPSWAYRNGTTNHFPSSPPRSSYPPTSSTQSKHPSHTDRKTQRQKKQIPYHNLH